MVRETADFDPRDMARMFRRLPEFPPITAEFDHAEYGTPRAPWYRSQREHMVGWFRAQSTTGAGQYTRRMPNVSAKRTYQRLQNAWSLLWINEALGVDIVLVRAAAEASEQETDHRRRCAVVRKMLPWENLVPLIEAHGVKPLHH